ncbi:MAG TPA: AAA family ATPase [Trebonia sp.]
MAGPILRGRAEEQRLVAQALERTWRTGQGSLIVVTGEAGIGKSALVEWAIADAAVRGFAVGLGKAEESDQIAPLAPLLVALRSGTAPMLSGDVFHGLAAFDRQQLWLVDRLADALEKRATEVPLLICVDDLQWADALTLFALRLLPGRLASSPVVWLLASRFDATGHSDGVAEAAARDLPVSQLELGPLAATAVTQLAVDRLGARPDEQLGSLLSGAAGNPFLIIELLAGAAPEAGEIPGNLIRRVRHRLRHLPPQTLSLLQAGSVLGRAFTVDDAAALLERPPAEAVLPWLAAAQRDGIISDDGRHIAFRHDLLRQAVYADIPASVRRSMHRAAAEHLLAAGSSPLDAVPHVLVAATVGDVQAALVLRDAAVGEPRVIPEVAAELMLGAFNLLPAGEPRRPQVGTEAIELLAAAGHTEDALTVADTLLDAGLPADTAAEIEDRAADALWSTGQLPRIVRRVEAALARNISSAKLRARLAAWRALGLSTADPEVAAVAGREARQAAEEAGDLRALVTAQRALGEMARNDGRNDAALGHFRNLRRLTAAPSFTDEVLSLQLLDRYSESARLLSDVQGGLQLSGASSEVYAYHFARMWQDFCVGHLDDVETAANTLLRLGDDLKQLTYHNEARILLGRIAQLRGDYDGAREQLRRVLPRVDADDMGTPFMQRYARVLLAAAEGDVATALGTVHAMLSSDGFLYHRWRWQPTWFIEVTPIALAGGDLDLAEQLADQAAQLAERNPEVLTNAGVAAIVRGLVRDDLTGIQHGATLLQDAPRPSIRATAALELGERLLRDGRSDRAVAALQEAWKASTQMGATGQADAARKLLLRSGVPRPQWEAAPDRPAHGWDALTAAEQRVARLIAAGHTNRSAAAELFISSNTIATHVRSIFRKLDVKSRVQLANAVRKQR